MVTLHAQPCDVNSKYYSYTDMCIHVNASIYEIYLRGSYYVISIKLTHKFMFIISPSLPVAWWPIPCSFIAHMCTDKNVVTINFL